MSANRVLKILSTGDRWLPHAYECATAADERRAVCAMLEAAGYSNMPVFADLDRDPPQLICRWQLPDLSDVVYAVRRLTGVYGDVHAECWADGSDTLIIFREDGGMTRFCGFALPIEGLRGWTTRLRPELAAAAAANAGLRRRPVVAEVHLPWRMHAISRA